MNEERNNDRKRKKKRNQMGGKAPLPVERKNLASSNLRARGGRNVPGAIMVFFLFFSLRPVGGFPLGFDPGRPGLLDSMVSIMAKKYSVKQ